MVRRGALVVIHSLRFADQLDPLFSIVSGRSSEHERVSLDQEYRTVIGGRLESWELNVEVAQELARAIGRATTKHCYGLCERDESQRL